PEDTTTNRKLVALDLFQYTVPHYIERTVCPGIFDFAGGWIDLAKRDVHPVFCCGVFILPQRCGHPFIQQVEYLSGFGYLPAPDNVVQQEVSNQRQQCSGYAMAGTVDSRDKDFVLHRDEPREIAGYHIPRFVEDK